MSTIGRYLPQYIQEKGWEIRTFMPKYGCINERRNQLHEVIRLSGMNLIINEMDHPLIIKVASIQQARMQIYFIDNEDYFHRKFIFKDKNGKFFKDNDERSVFFCRGVLETVKKLSWAPDIIHCQGWISNLIPLYIKKAFKDNPLFNNSKVIYSIYDEEINKTFNKDFPDFIKLDGISDKILKPYSKANYESITKSAIDFADALIIGSPKINSNISSYIKGIKKPVLEYQDEDKYLEAYSNFYNELLGK